MNDISKIIRLTVPAVAFSVGWVGLLVIANAQLAPELVITWRANTYAPDFFQGKKLPIRGASISLAAQLVDNDRLIDASDKEVRWYADNNLINSGLGLNNFTYVIPQNSGDLLSIRSVIIHRGVEVNQFSEIPIADPEAVIDDSQLPQLKPYFYFFNVNSPNDLDLGWEENSQSITLTAQNPKNLLETAVTTTKKQ